MKIRLLFLVLILSLTHNAKAGDFHPEAAGDLAKDGIWVNIAFSGTNTITTFRALFNHPTDKVFEILTDTSNMPKRHASNYSDARTLTRATYDKIIAAKPQTVEDLLKIIGNERNKSDLNRVKGGSWTDYTYLNFNFPWPLSNRWQITLVKIQEPADKTGNYRFEFKMVVGNFKSTSGYWELIPNTDGTTEFRGEYHSDPGIDLPRFATKLGSKMGFKREYDENKAALKQKYGDK